MHGASAAAAGRSPRARWPPIACASVSSGCPRLPTCRPAAPRQRPPPPLPQIAGGVIKGGVNAVSAGAKALKAGYDAAAPLVKQGVDAVAPVVQSAVKATGDAAAPVVKQAAPLVQVGAHAGAGGGYGKGGVGRRLATAQKGMASPRRCRPCSARVGNARAAAGAFA